LNVGVEIEIKKLKAAVCAEAQGMLAKLVSACMGVLIKGSMKKARRADLVDIKTSVERR